MSSIIKFSPAFYVILFIASYIILFLYGSEYTIIIPMLMLFILAGLIAIVHNIYMWFAASFGISGVKISSISEIITVSINTITAWFLIQSYGLYGAIISMLIAYITGTILAYLLIKRFLLPRDTEHDI